MTKKLWEVQYLSYPPIRKYCKKCGKKIEFTCSEQFRVNAQRKYLDIWLIYKCSNCDTTWNASIYSRISPESINPKRLESFHTNDKELVEEYAMDSSFLRRNGVEVGLPPYCVIGDSLFPEEAVELEIKTNYSFPIKISSLVRNKLQLSQKEYSQLIMDEKIKSIPRQDLLKCRLKDGFTLMIQNISIF